MTICRRVRTWRSKRLMFTNDGALDQPADLPAMAKGAQYQAVMPTHDESRPRACSYGYYAINLRITPSTFCPSGFEKSGPKAVAIESAGSMTAPPASIRRTAAASVRSEKPLHPSIATMTLYPFANPDMAACKTTPSVATPAMTSIGRRSPARESFVAEWRKGSTPERINNLSDSPYGCSAGGRLGSPFGVGVTLKVSGIANCWLNSHKLEVVCTTFFGGVVLLLGKMCCCRSQRRN